MPPCATEFIIRARGSNQDVIKEEPYDINGFNPPPNNGKKRKDQNAITASTFHVDLINTSDDVIELSSSDSEDESTPSCNDSHKHLVVYDPFVNGGAPEAFPNPISYKIPPFRKVLPSIGTYTVQCANCFKWRLIPTQEKYEEIREHITEKPFVCATAHDWRPNVSYDDPPDIEQDGSKLWAIDKPNIAQPPPGWQRDVRIRGEGSTKFADIYYTSPKGAKLRSKCDIQKYLFKHPEYVEQGVTLAQFSFQIPKPLQISGYYTSPKGAKLRSKCDIQKYLFKHPEYVEQGVTLAQFSFQIPKPLQENYVRKRPSRAAALKDGNHMGLQLPGPFEPSPAMPMALPGPNQYTDLQLAIPGFSAQCAFNPMNPSPKKPRSAPGKPRHNFDSLYKHREL